MISATMHAAVGLFVLFAGFSAVLSRSPDYDYVQLEPDQSSSVPDGWTHVEQAAEDEYVTLTLALRQQNVDILEELFWKVSNPKDESYGEYLSLDDIAALVQPSNETIAEVEKWLGMAGITDCDTIISKDFMTCSMTVREAQGLLGDVTFHRYTNGERMVIKSEVKYQVPRHLQDHLDFVGGVHRFPAGLTLKTEEKVNNTVGIHVGVYPKVIRERYGIKADEVGSHPNNTQAVSQFLEQFYSPADLSEFFSMFVGGGFKHVKDMAKVVGPDTGRSGLEASLDTQYITSTGANIPTWFWSTAGRHDNQEPFLTWLYAMGNTTTVPWVNSVSYGEEEVTLSVAYMQRVSVEFMKAGVRGITLLFASGDDGASCKKGKFSPAFPGSSPYVTTVGATGFKNPFSVGDEKGVDFSGGGFSNVFPQPAYQNESIALYLKIGKNIPDEKYFNKSGRAYPDIAALGRHYWIINNRVPFPGVMGTSASTPVTAGIISLINDKRLTASKPSMGFLNPFLYQNAHVLNDVVDGYNEGCQAHDIGFYAGEKWDPVTGNGSPMYHPLLEAAMNV